MKRAKFLRSAAVLSVGGIAAKAIGALYRIPLSNLLGGFGMGLYHMAYPLYCVLLAFSSAGIPTAFSRLIARETARGQGSRETLRTALRLFAGLGLCGAALMCLIAPLMSRLQGQAELSACYTALAPSVFFVSLIAVLRGYFQGKSRMAPTAVSELCEELVKAGAGLLFARRFSEDPVRAVVWCLAAVSLSEAAALLYLMLRVRGAECGPSLSARRTSGSEVFFSALPVMASAGLMPLSRTADSVLVVRLLPQSSVRAVSLYGLYAGGALSLVSLPATACYGLAAASVPAVSRACARGDGAEAQHRALWALFLTLLLSLPCALGLFFLARPVVSLLYPALAAGDRETLVSLVRLLSVSAVSIAGVDTLAACLAGMGRAKHAALSMLLAVTLKFLLQWWLVPALSVIGAAVAANASYLVAFFLDLFYTVRKKRVKQHDNHCKSRNGAGRSLPSGAGGAEAGGRSACADRRNSLGADA